MVSLQIPPVWFASHNITDFIQFKNVKFAHFGKLSRVIICINLNFVGVDTMERGALVGMMSLAVSDMLFCIVTITSTNMPAAKMIYNSKDFVFFYTLYANCAQNILVKTSTWFTVILGACRNFVVSNPITARKYLKCRHTVTAIVLCTVIWILLHIPLAYTFAVRELNCPTGTKYLLKSGPFAENHKLRVTFIYVWFIIGFIIPVCVLAYCNTKLIWSLSHSVKLRRHDSSNRIQSVSIIRKQSQRRLSETSHCSVLSKQGCFSNFRMKSSTGTHSLNSFNQKRISYTLIAIVLLFFICIFPSEIVLFYAEINRPAYKGTFRFMINFVNLLQAINSSGNFVLYCLVNGYFRKTLKQWCRCICGKCFRFRMKEETNSSLMDKWSSRRSSRFSKMSLVTKLSNPSQRNVNELRNHIAD